MRVVPLASSSKGNAYAVVGDGAVVLIDCGLTCKRVVECCCEKGIDLGALAGILITHDHSDHVGGLKVFLKRYDVKVYANLMTAEKLISEYAIDPQRFVCFENGQPFEVADFGVTAFSTPHDAVDSVGFFFERGEATYFHATDVGTPLDSIGRYLAKAETAVLESNHDPVLLRTSQRQESLKKRISGPRGHLSNDQAAELVRSFATPRLKRLMLAHLSEECNAAHLAESTMREALASAGLGHVELSIIQ
jgi:phosphoribosyl 1,2-cyclic phosphodiesterase